MKTCPYCGLQNDDTASQCATCHTPLATPPVSAATEGKPEYRISPQESRFWERMSFRQFAVLMVRLQALWLLFNAAVDVTYLPRYLSRWWAGSAYRSVSTELGHELALATLRIVLHVAAALLILQYAEQLLSWLVKDWVAKQPPGPALGSTAGAAGSPEGSGAPGGGSRGSA